MKHILLILVAFCYTTSQSQEINALDSQGKRHGKWLKKYDGSDQVRYEGTFDHGKEVGKFKFYKPSSGDQPTAVKLFSKAHDTATITYYTSKGKIVSEGKMVQKERTGTWKYYHQDGVTLMMTENYIDGQLTGDQTTFFENGKPAEKKSFVDGKENGRRLVYLETGKLIKDISFVNGKQHGPAKYYEKDGSLKIEGTYKNNRKYGVWKYYNNGTLVEEKIFPVNRKSSK